MTSTSCSLVKITPQINFPFSPQLKILAAALLDQGDELRLVGGCVRDFLINRPIADIDLACKYPPEKTLALLNKHHIQALPTGIKHGTITAIIQNQHFEITSLRSDVKTFGRQAQVQFIDDYYLDAQRRDFTINAFYLDFAGNLYDYCGGWEDLKNQRVRFIGDPEARIKEDYLRILRFFRFSCYYAQFIDEAGLKASVALKGQIRNLSAQRINNELSKILTCYNQDHLLAILELMNQNLILAEILTKAIDLTDLKNLLSLEKKLSRKLLPARFNCLLRFAALIDHQDNFLAKKLSFSNQEIKYLQALQVRLDFNGPESKILGLLFDYSWEVIIGNLLLNLSRKSINLEEAVAKILMLEQILSKPLPVFSINGHDLLNIGIEPVKIGKLLLLGRNYWISHDFKPSKAEIIKFITDYCLLL